MADCVLDILLSLEWNYLNFAGRASGSPRMIRDAKFVLAKSGLSATRFYPILF
jgi:hypothetical protein